MEIDILEGECGPTSTSLHKIPHIKLIHVRFIPGPVEVDKVGVSMRSLCPRKDVSASISLSVRNNNYGRSAKSAESPPKSSTVKKNKTFPKILSMYTMLNLGRVAKHRLI